MMKINSETELLNAEVRKKLIEHWSCQANQRRKDEAFKAYECLKDKTNLYVLELLLKQFDQSTVTEMQYAVSNVSILRKVIDKLAKVYANGVKRTMPVEAETQPIEKAATVLKLDDAMKKANRYFRTFKNTMIYVRPMQVEDKFTVKVEVKAPFYYDVVENPNNPEEAMAVVLSDYVPSREEFYALGNAATAGRQVGKVREVQAPTSAKAGEEDKREFIWWTKSFHFTTNAKGELLSTGENDTGENPILELPFVNLAGDQDGCFFAEGGSDLVDSGIKTNVMITNVNHVSISQGYGQLYMTGKNLPKAVKVGPNHCVQLEHEEGEPVPTVGYLNSNPPIGDLKALIEMGVALMLSTNNLSTSGFATSLSGAKDFASGIAMMIDKSESIEDVGEQAKVFIEKEPKVWSLIGRWAEVYGSRNLLIDEIKALKLPKEIKDVQLAFPSSKPMISELDELAVIEKRQTLGLNTRIELLMRDNPALTAEEAEKKLALIDKEKQERAEAFGTPEGGDDATGTGNVADADNVDADSSDVGDMGDANMKGDKNGNQSKKGNGNAGKNSGNA